MTLIDVSTLVGLGLASALALYALIGAALGLVTCNRRNPAAGGDCREKMLVESGEGARGCPETSA